MPQSSSTGLSSSSYRSNNSLHLGLSTIRRSTVGVPPLSSRSSASRLSQTVHEKARPVGVGDRISSLRSSGGFVPPPRVSVGRNSVDLNKINPLDTSCSDMPARGLSICTRTSTLGQDVKATRERILADTERCERELNDKCREKSALAKLLEDLKKRKSAAKARRAKQHHALDTMKAKSGESERLLTKARHQIKLTSAELSNEEKIVRTAEEARDRMKSGALRAGAEIDHIQSELEHESVKMQATRKEFLECNKQKDTLLNDIRVTKSALQLMEQRVSDLRMQTEALESILADALRLN